MRNNRLGGDDEHTRMVYSDYRLRLVAGRYRSDCCWGLVGGGFLITINLRRARDIAVASLVRAIRVLFCSAPLANFVMLRVGLSARLIF